MTRELCVFGQPVNYDFVCWYFGFAHLDVGLVRCCSISHVCHGIDVCSIDVVEFPIVCRSFQHGVSICLVWMLFSLRVVCNWSAVSFLQPKLQVFQVVTMVSRYPGAFGGAAVGDGDLGSDEGIEV